MPHRRARDQADPVADTVELRAQLDAALEELQEYVRLLKIYVRGQDDGGVPDE